VNKTTNSGPRLSSNHGFRAVTAKQIRQYHLSDVKPLLGYVGQISDESIWLEQPLPKGWRAAYRLIPKERRRGQYKLVIAEVRIFPAEEGVAPGEWSGTVIGHRANVPVGGLPWRVMNHLRKRETLDVVKQILENIRQQHEDDSSESERPDDKFGVDEGVRSFLGLPEDSNLVSTKRLGPGRRPARKLRFFLEFAIAYDAAERNRSKGNQGTRRLLAGRFGVSEATVSGWIRKCRKLGLITKTREGRRGGEAPEELRRALAFSTITRSRRPNG
jgi:hypothetical protein